MLYILYMLLAFLKGVGGGGFQAMGWSKFVFNAIIDEGCEGYQMLFTESKNIDCSQSYCSFKFGKYIQLHCGRML